MRFSQLAGFLIFLLVGCGQSNIAAVSGRVRLNEKPLVNAKIIFQPITDDVNPGPGSSATTDTEGKFTLKLMKKEFTPGAIVGKHRVMITAFEGDENPPPGGNVSIFRKALVPSEYNSETTLTFSVPPEGSKQADFDLQGK